MDTCATPVNTYAHLDVRSFMMTLTPFEEIVLNICQSNNSS